MPESHSPELSHRNHPSRANPGESFPEPWVGQSPTIAQRRDYLTKYFLWARKLDNPREYLSRCLRASLKSSAKRFFEKGQKRVLKVYFWYVVDKAVWRLVFDYYASDEPKPEWPWRKPIPETSATFSTTYEMWFKALKAAKKPRETSVASLQFSLKRPLESIEDGPAKRIVPKRSSGKVKQEDQGTDPLRIIVTHDVGHDGWPIVRYQAKRG